METPVMDPIHDPALEALRKELAGLLAGFSEVPGVFETAVPGLRISRREVPSEPIACFYEPVLAVVAQGAKEVVLARDRYVYDEAHYLLTSVDLPVASRVTLASPERPFLGLTLRIDPLMVGELLAGLEPARVPATPDRLGLSVNRMDFHLLDATLRLARLIRTPQDVPALAPLAVREIHYRLLTGPEGPKLRQLVLRDSQSQQIAKVIGVLKGDCARSLRVEDMARLANMSVSSFFHHFKSITAMSPLQFQKLLRLQEARRLLLTGVDAGSASLRVGYESPSHFSHDYSRLFGAPPLTDVTRFRSRGEGVVAGNRAG